jgi:isocitrate/isopropylmalate dehydrogenase
MLTRAVFSPSRPAPSQPFLIGALPGEGVGPAVVAAALEVLAAVGPVSGRAFEVRCRDRTSSISASPMSGFWRRR